MEKRTNYRAARIVKDKDQKVGILATEAPVPMYQRNGKFINEVLLMDGMRMPANNEVTLLDSHDRSSTRNIKGKFRNMRIENGQLLGDPVISSAEKKTKIKYDEGDIDSLSVGYDIYRTDFIDEGKKRSILGREFSGPMYVTSDWEPTEGSLVTLGADKLAKIRAAIIDTGESSATVAEPAIESTRSLMEENKQAPVVEKKVEAKPEQNTPDFAAFAAPLKPVDTKAIAETTLKEYKQFRSQVRAECVRLNLEDRVEDICEKSQTLDEARKLLIDMVAERQKPSAPRYLVVEDDAPAKARNVCKDVLYQRAVELLDIPDLDLNREKTPTPAALRKKEVQRLMPKGESDPRFERFGFTEWARFILESQGRDVRYERPVDILDEAMGAKRYHDYSTGWARDAGPLNSINQLQNIFADVQQKVLTLSYQISPVTYDLWCRKLQDAESMNDLHVMQLSGLSMLDVWIDGAKDHPLERKLTDAQEKIKLVYYGNNIVVSRQAMLTNQLDFISRVPQAEANAARQRFNNAAYSVITTNQVCGDGVALFNAAHNNLVTTGAYGGATVNSVQALNSTLRKQTGLDGGRIGLKGRFLIGPTVQEVAIGQICRGSYAPTQNLFEAWNPYQGLIPITDPELDTQSAVFHYLTPEPIYSAVAYTYLAQTPTPVITSYIRQDDGSLLMRVEMGGGCGVADFRGGVAYQGS